MLTNNPRRNVQQARFYHLIDYVRLFPLLFNPHLSRVFSLLFQFQVLVVGQIREAGVVEEIHLVLVLVSVEQVVPGQGQRVEES